MTASSKFDDTDSSQPSDAPAGKQSAGKQKYFNLHTTGIGYLKRIRTVKPAKGAPFLACTIAALNGPCDNPDYVYYDVKVSGLKAAALVRKCQEAVDAKSKVLISFKLGDPWIDTFTFAHGPKKGETGTTSKGRLLYIPWIKIDGTEVHRDQSRNANDGSDAESSVPPDASENVPEPPPVGDEAEAAATASEQASEHAAA